MRILFQKVFLFKCECEACVDDWNPDVFTEESPSDDELRRLSNYDLRCRTERKLMKFILKDLTKFKKKY